MEAGSTNITRKDRKQELRGLTLLMSGILNSFKPHLSSGLPKPYADDNSRLPKTIVFLFLFSLASFGALAQTTQTFLTDGSFTVPAGVSSLTVECWGGGGGGSTITSNGRRGGGGGGAAYARSILSVTGGSVYNIVVGTGGASNTVGESSSFGANLVMAIGGEGCLNNSQTGAAGGSAAASIGMVRFSGGNGANGGATYSGGGGGGAGSTGNGGSTINQNAGTGTAVGGGAGGTGVQGSANGNNGSIYGGGGSGAVTNSNTDRYGGSGAGGLVIVTMTCPVYSLSSTSATSVCTGNPSVVSLTASTAGLPTGVYTVTYNLSGSNTATAANATLTVSTAGTAAFNTLSLLNAGTTTVTITNLASAGCNNAIASNNTANIAITSLPAQPGTLSGNISPCIGSSQTYSVANVPGVTYIWAFPAGWIQTGGAATSSVQVTVGAGAGNISVTPSNTCGSGSSRLLAVTVTTIPAQPSVITGNASPCAGSPQTYSVINVAGVSYAWTLPSGWTITGGAPTNTITVLTGSNSGNITVIPSNACGAGIGRTLAVFTTDIPSQPGIISGPGTPCVGSTLQNYSVLNMAGIIFTWSFPAGWVITAGQGTNSVYVTAGATAGLVTVTPSNACGNGAFQSLPASPLAIPLQPSVIAGNATTCLGTAATYSVIAIPGVAYTWTVPTGWNITSGQGTSIISTNSGASGQSGTLSVTAGNPCGTSAAATLAVTVITVPSQTGSITPSTPNVCQNSIQNYMVSPPPPSGVIYTWSGPPGSLIISGQGTQIIQIRYGTISGTLSVTPSNICGNGAPQTMAVNVFNSVPAQPGPISGQAAPCAGSTQSYSVPAVGGLTYTWSVPAGWTILSGQGTNAITTLTTVAAGNIQVVAGNACGGSAPRLLAVLPRAAVPAQPSPITGSTAVCLGNMLSYSVINVATVIYTWSLPTDWTLLSGQGTNIINVSAGVAAGNISVTPSNDCGNGLPRLLAISVDTSIPADTGPIAGNSSPCENSSQVYSVADQPGVTYTWTATAGNVVTAGQGTNSVTVTIGPNPGTLTMTPSNACGIGHIKFLDLLVSPLPAFAGSISGNALFCEGSIQTYSVTNVPGLTYQWVVPAGWTINGGQGTHTISVNTGINSGNVVLTPLNGCGAGPSSVLAVTVNPLPAAYTGPERVICAGASVQIGGPAVPGNAYAWTSIPAGFASALSNPLVAPDDNTTYSLIETTLSTGCSRTNQVNVIANQVITVFITPPSQTICTSASTSIQLSSNISYTTYKWDPVLTAGSGTTGFSPGIGPLIAQTILNASSIPSVVTYTVTAMANECVNHESTVDITINPAPLVNGNTKTVCSDLPLNILLGTSTNGLPVASYTISNIQANGMTASAGSPSTGTGFSVNALADDAWTNLTTNPVHVIYTAIPVSALGCGGAPYTIDITVLPKPSITSLSAKAICSGTATGINLTSNIPSAFLWTVGTITGGITGASPGSGSFLNQVLTNPGNSTPGSVVYLVTPVSLSGSCTGAAFPLTITVNPAPIVLNSASTHVCSGSNTNLALLSSIPSSFTWTVGTITGGITGAAAGSGTAINQVLFNPSPISSGSVQYIVTPASITGSCAGMPFTITILVDPLPTVNAVSGSTNCSGILVPAIPFTSNPAGGTFAWTSNINIGFGTYGTGNIPAFTALNLTAAPVTAIVSVTATLNGCTGSATTFTIIVNPAPTPTITADYCSIPGHIQLTANPAGMQSYLWNTGTPPFTTRVIVVDAVAIYNVTVTNSQGCSATAYLSVSTELVTDGSFTNFIPATPAFFTEYTQNQAFYTGVNTSGLWPEGYYAVNTSAWSGYPGAPNGYHPSFHGRDHTNNSAGLRKFMMINGSTSLINTPPPPHYRTIWQQTVAIQPNKDYYFSAWAMNLNPASPAKLQFEINGIPVGTFADLDLAPKPTDESQVDLSNWVRFYSNPTWNSGANTTAIIRIINLNTTAGGNDFGLDDISFGTLSPVPFTFAPTIIGGSNTVCEGATLQFNTNISGGMAPYTVLWTGPNGFTSTLENPSIPNVTLAAQGIYHATVHDSYGCTPQTKDVGVTINPAPNATITGGGSFCQFAGSPFIWFNGSNGTAPYTFEYNINGGPTQSITTWGTDNNVFIFAANSITGTFSYNLTRVYDSKGCSRTVAASAIVIINPLPFAYITGDQQVCPNSGNVYSGNGPMAAYDWSITGAGAITGSSHTQNITVTSANLCNQPFVLGLMVTDMNGCNANAEETIIVEDHEAPVIYTCPPAKTYIGINVSVITPLPYSETPVSITEAQFNAEGGTAGDNCHTPVYSYSDTRAGSAPIVVTRTYRVTDQCGNVTLCIQVITINSQPPDISCSNPPPVNAEPGLCSAVVNPPEPTVNAGEPVTWSWVMSGVTTASGTGPIGNTVFNVGATTITWTATNVSGTDVCIQTITVVDNQAPTFSIPPDLSYCVQDIYTANYWDPTVDITPARPEYYLFVAGNTALNLNTATFNDNCGAGCIFEIRWRIDFQDGSFLPALPATYISGQPSAYGTNIQFPGSVTVNQVHLISYRIMDCHGNISATQSVTVTVTPRPNVIKLN